VRPFAGAAAAVAAIVLLGAQNGGFFADSWGWVALPLLLVTAGIVFAGVDVPVSRGELLWLGGLALLAAWSALSAVWAPDAGAPVVEAERVVLYLAAAAATVLLGARALLPYAVLAASVVLSAWALAEKLLGHDGGPRLAGPIGYTNGLGLVAATGAILAVGLARRRPALLATLAVSMPALVLTYSRGAWLALASGMAVLVALAVRSRPRVLIGLTAAGVVLVAVALVAGRHGGAPSSGNVSARLSSLSGNGRGGYWRVALDEASAHPLLGGGAGTWDRWWLAHRPNANGALDAHSLYLETLAEVGPFGVALLAALLALPLAFRRRALRHDWAPACAAAYVALLVHAALDWDWELPAVALCGLLCGVALLGDGDARRLRARPAVVATTLALAAAVFVLQVGNAAQRSAARNLDNARAGDAAAAARRARAWQPWTATPRLLLGEAQLAAGDVDTAARTFAGVTRSDPGNAEAWFQLALATRGPRHTFARARPLLLDPHGPAAALP
jgi:O-antigen ligase